MMNTKTLDAYAQARYGMRVYACPRCESACLIERHLDIRLDGLSCLACGFSPTEAISSDSREETFQDEMQAMRNLFADSESRTAWEGIIYAFGREEAASEIESLKRHFGDEAVRIAASLFDDESLYGKPDASHPKDALEKAKRHRQAHGRPQKPTRSRIRPRTREDRETPSNSLALASIGCERAHGIKLGEQIPLALAY